MWAWKTSSESTESGEPNGKTNRTASEEAGADATYSGATVRLPTTRPRKTGRRSAWRRAKKCGRVPS